MADLPLEVPSELPLDILRVISLVDSASYFLMVQTCRGIAIPNAMAKFCVYRECVYLPTFEYIVQSVWLLPNGNPHSPDANTPAITLEDDHMRWYHNGRLHRDGGPAIINNDNGKTTQKWYRHGKQHRDDGPATIMSDRKEWWVNGRRYRANDKPQVVIHPFDPSTKRKIWYRGNNIHRDNDLPAVVSGDVQKWYQHNKLHRDSDLPAYIFEDVRKWYQHDELHRDGDLPAVVDPNFQMWYQHGLLHRDNDMPAAVYASGYKKWYQCGKLHRGDDLPAVIAGDLQEWYKFGKLHRNSRSPDASGSLGDDLPAVINKYNKVWYTNGMKHRLDAPAVVEEINGINEWWNHGRFLYKTIKPNYLYGLQSPNETTVRKSNGSSR
jgi:hypothetical protein